MLRAENRIPLVLNKKLYSEMKWQRMDDFYSCMRARVSDFLLLLQH